MSGVLGELLAWGFEVCGRRFEWGTSLETVARATGLAPVGQSLDLPPGELYGFPTIGATTSAAVAGPVGSQWIQLAPESGLETDAGLAAARQRLDAELGPGEHEWLEKQPARARSRWVVAGARVGLDAYTGLFGFPRGKSPAALTINADGERLAQPYIPTFRAEDAPWQQPGEVEILPAPRLKRLTDPPFLRDEISFALGHPELRATPAWVRERFDEPRDELAVWHHPASGTRGVASDVYTLPFAEDAPPELRHVRTEAFRGSGGASLGLLGGEELFYTQQGPSGLDAVAGRLAELGVPVTLLEDRDYG